MKRSLVLLVTIAVCMAAIPVAAVPALARAAPDSAALSRLLDEFLAGASRNDAATHDRFWADDLIYTGSAGRRIGKAEIMKDVREAPPARPTEPTTVYSAEEVRIQQYGTTAIVAFRLVAITTDSTGAQTVAKFLNSGTFLKRGGRWQAVNWQATRMPPPEPKPAGERPAAPRRALHRSLPDRR